ncbi:RDD family protein [Clostridium sp. OS1-26]|uniref:RDD family protein n=1 Tax=Clostridium sp. OS1-26 TaxID=3070681 RepID=UPI0027E0AC93|nr:RDD family protein [Clostridium sp. OS1-26]WML37626.1 RDD family protein [Clostridium sp. OS1-26]
MRLFIIKGKSMKKEKRLDYKIKPKGTGNVPHWKRFVGYMIDWYVGYIFTCLPMVLIYMKITNSQNFNINLLEYPKQYALLAGNLGLLFALFYYVIVPLKVWKGQTLGKRFCHFKIVKLDGNDVLAKEVFLRQVVGIFLVESTLFFPSKLFEQVLSIVSNITFFSLIIYVGMAITILSSFFVLYRKDQRAIHDLISNTTVINIGRAS